MSNNSNTRQRAASPLSGIRLGSIAGVGVILDWSLLIIFALITLVLSAGLLPAWHPDWSGFLIALTAAAAAVLFIVSILIHELSHALVGRRLGMRIESITLFVFGGMAHLEGEPRSWRTEFAMAIVGPLTSLALGFGFIYLAGLDIDYSPGAPISQLELIAGLGPLTTILFWLGPVNILIGLFNLVPGFPLDGGRVLRSVIWGITGDRVRATRWAAAFGQGFAWLLIASGFAMILGLRVPILGTGLVGGLWVALIGWFLNNAALMSYRREQLGEQLEGLTVKSVMHHDYTPVAADISVRKFVDDHLLGSSQRTFPVIEEGRFLGLVCLEDVRRLARDRYVETRLREIMTPREQLHTLTPSMPAETAFDQLSERRVNQLPVVESEQLVGLVDREDIIKWLSLNRYNRGGQLFPGR